jgi:phosphocarrier protein
VAEPGSDRAVVRREARIVNKQGWHLRPAAMVVRCAMGFKSDVMVSVNGASANGKSMFDMSMLASPLGSLVEIEVSGADAEACADAIEALITSGFGEELA